MRTFILLCSLILGVLSIRAQEASSVPGLLREYRAATTDTARSRTLSKIGFNLILSDPDSARTVATAALSLAMRTMDPKSMGEAHHSLGWLAATQGELDSADLHMHKALALFQRAQDQVSLAPALGNLGWLAEKRGDEVGALKYFLDALKQAEIAQDSSSVAGLYYSIGISYRKIGEFEQAIDFLDRSLAMERALDRPNKIGLCLTALANCYNQQDDNAHAIAYYNQAAQVFKTLGNKRQLGLVQENIGTLLNNTMPDSALNHYQQALTLYTAVDSKEDKAYIMRIIGSLLSSLGQLDKSEQMLDQGQALAKEIGAHRLVMKYERNFGELAAAQGKAEATMEHYESYLALKDSLDGEDNAREMARLRTSFDTERKEKDNIILRAENTVQHQQLRNRNLQLYGTLVIGLLAIIAAFLFRHNYRQKRKHADLLEGLNRQLGDSHAEITEINGLLEMKVLRSQMNPHFIYNCLNSAAQMAKAGKQEETHAYLHSFARLLRTVLDQSVKDMVPLDEVTDFLDQYLKLETRRLPGLRYTITVDPELAEQDVEIPALLIQPFVENAIWHGLPEKEGEPRLDVSFKQNEGRVVCSITDNGIGREQAAGSSKGRPGHRSLGMELTNERLRLLSRKLRQQGSVEVDDLTDKDGSPLGTRVILTI